MGRYSIMSFDEGFPSMGLKIWAKVGTTIQIAGDNKLLYTWKVKSNVHEQKECDYFIQTNKTLWEEYQKLSAIRQQIVEKVFNSDKGTHAERKAARATTDSLDSISNTY